MLFTHHSHSGQFCTHATSTLKEVTEAAITRGLTSITLTEHIPRDEIDFYPNESSHPLLAKRSIWQLFADYHAEALRLRTLYSDRIEIFIGFEGEWIRGSRSAKIIRELQGKYEFDVWIGSVHHVHSIPIDYNREVHLSAREKAGGTDVALARDYFDAQEEMLRTLRPPIVGHFDLIRLLADEGMRDRDWRTWEEGVWEKIVRNLEVVREYGGVLEINSAALRKGLGDVYPRREIMEEFHKMGGKFTLSDDSHGVDQLCTHYEQALDCVERAGISELVYFTKRGSDGVTMSDQVSTQSVPISTVRARLLQYKAPQSKP